MNDSDNASNDNVPFSSVDAEVKEALASLRQDAFAPGFEDRALARWNRERAASSSTPASIERRARQFLPLAIAASLLVAVYSANRNSTPSASLVARALGWPSAGSVTSNELSQRDTYEAVYSSLYGLPLVNSSQGAQ